MTYKDKDKQREAQRNWVRQKRKDSTLKGSTNQGSTVIPNKLTIQTLEKSGRGEGLTEFDNAAALLEDLHDTKLMFNNGECSPPSELRDMKDVFPKTTRLPTHKRGKDIKCFADLPPDIQETIDMMSTTDGKIDKTIKANRTAIAINYQHLFPDRYIGQDAHILSLRPLVGRTGEVTGKPGDADYNGVCTEVWRAERGR